MERLDYRRRGVVRRWGLGALFVGATACKPDIDCSLAMDLGGVEGELGNGSFEYLCADGAFNPACDSGSWFPQAFAVGGEFGLVFRTDDDELLPVRTANEALLAGDGERFTALAAGTVDVYAVDEERIVDFVTLELREIDELRFVLPFVTVTGELEMNAGERLMVGASPYAKGDIVLGGAVPYTWEVEDETIVELTITDGEAELHAVREGQTEIRVTAGTGVGVLLVVVGGGAGGSSESSSGSGESESSGGSTG